MSGAGTPRTPALLLIAANMIPLAGVLFWNWSLFQIVALYWMENVILGVINLLKMFVSTPGPDAGVANQPGNPTAFADPGTTPEAAPRIPDRTAVMANNTIKVFLMPFFTVHYGMFCFVHGIFVFVLLGNESGGMAGGLFSSLPRLVERAISDGGLWAVAALAGSHLFSFVYHFIIGGEFRRISAPLLMVAPYGRIVVLHIAILFGAFAITSLGSPIFLLILLVAGKTVLDLTLHLRSHRTRSVPAA